MIINLIRTTFRHLWKNKTYSSLNIAGLAIGIVCAGFIFLWLEDEVNYDNHIPNKENLYKILTNQTYQGKTRAFHSSPGKLAAAIKEEIPGIEESGRVSRNFQLFSAGEKNIYEAGCYADASILKMFGMEFLNGQADNAFKQLNSVVITEKMANRFFGSVANAAGKTLQLEHGDNFQVTGVIKDFPVNSTFHPDWIIPFEVHAKDKFYLTIWGANAVNTYVTLSNTSSADRVNQQLHGFISGKDAGATAKPFLFAANDWRLRANFEDGKQTGGSITYVRMFGIIAWIVLLIACINFMNLATARSEKRAREVGVRKVMGAGKGTLTLQFIGESFCMTILAVITGLLLMALLLPAFNALVEKKLTLDLLKPIHLFSLLGITLVCGLVAGSYPSLYLSSFSPINVLKGLKIKTSNAGFIRKGLVIFQFTTSIVLIISTIIIYQQIKHVTGRDLGYNKENLLQADVKGNLVDHYDVVKQQLLNSGYVQNVALSSTEILYTGNNTSGYSWKGKDADADILISYRSITQGFFDAWGMTITEGRDFYENSKADSNNIIISSSLATLLGKGSALGKIITDGDDQLKVVGVIKDFVYGDMYGKGDPVLFRCQPGDAEKMIIRLKPDADVKEAMAGIAPLMEKATPGYPFSYRFVDELFNELFVNEMLISKLASLFALLAIIISCLGIFGLAAYMAERRVKEIGVRKVLGASTANITSLLSKDFLQLVLAAAIIAFPIAWYAMSQWLSGYAYRIGINWWVFIAAGIVAIFIALLTISFQSVKAAMANPVKSLKAE
ncbi:ABC transporter permease [uncultured Chitinophaga sp.]|uniref:ABC transporter permease n=1 Tax=uncultured Chitinophaga sp. TaxID=339340 RepID=UPI0025F9E3AF|nr:ABC transporter permease [uncultured Chitinophaga sp.]